MSTPTQTELEQSIKEVNDAYNAVLEELIDLEQSFRDAESKSFSILQNLYKQYKNTDAALLSSLSSLETDYQNSLSVVEERRKECYDKQQTVLRHLQKLRTLQNTYLVGVINGLNTQLSELKGQERPNNLTA